MNKIQIKVTPTGRNNNVVTHNKIPYPQPDAPDLPKNFFTSLFIGARNTGKTTLVVKLLKLYEHTRILDHEGKKVDQRIILFSPTIEANPIYETLKYLDEDDLHVNYSDNKLIKVIKNIKHEKEQTDEYKEKMKLYLKFVRSNIENLTDDEIMELERMNYEPPPKPRYPNGVVNHILFDDLVGTDAFKIMGRSALTNLVLKNRHLQCNIYIMAQSLRTAIPKPIRNNTSLFALFRYANIKMVLKDVFEEISAFFTETQFRALYNYATKDSHSALVIDFTRGRQVIVKKNFEEILEVNRMTHEQMVMEGMAECSIKNISP